MKVCLIFPSRSAQDVSMPNLSIYLIAAILIENGYDVDVFDQATYFERRIINIPKYDVVCISSNTFNWAYAKNIISEIKTSCSDIPIVLGGVHPSRFDEYILHTTNADYIIVGEGEKGIVELFEALKGQKKLEDILSLTYRDVDGEIKKNPLRPFLTPDELSELPTPAYHLIDTNIYSALTYEFSRGCVNSCVFCSSMYIKKWRPFSIKRIVDGLQNNLPVISKFQSQVFATDDCFTTSRKRMAQICQAVKEKELPIEFGIEAKVKDLQKKEVFKYLWELDVFFIQIGVECGYNKGLRLVNKNINIEEVISCADKLNSEGLVENAIFSFIIGFPWESKNDCITTLNFARDLVSKYGGFANVSWWTPIPSQLYDTRHEFGCGLDEQIFDDKDWLSNITVFEQFHPYLSSSEVKEILSYFINNIKRKYNVKLNTNYLGTETAEFHTLLTF